MRAVFSTSNFKNIQTYATSGQIYEYSSDLAVTTVQIKMLIKCGAGKQEVSVQVLISMDRFDVVVFLNYERETGQNVVVV